MRKVKQDTQVNIKHVFTADFETTSESNLKIDGEVRVYIWSLINVGTNEKYYGYDMQSFLRKIQSVECKICFFHNLKFDGNFLLYWMVTHGEKFTLVAPNGEWFYLQWRGIEFRDSAKKVKLSVAGLAVMLGIPHKEDPRDENGKYPWDYYIPAGYIAPYETVHYCIHDSEIVAEFIRREWAQGRTRLTSSSEAFHNAKQQLPKYKTWFPQLPTDVDSFVRHGYRGGVCALNPAYANEEIEHLYNYDVNGLYGYVMQTAELPYGQPFWREPCGPHEMGFVHFNCEFYVKKNKFPMMQVKRNIQYANRESEYLKESNGMTELWMSSIDYKMFKSHYDIENDWGYEWMSYQTRNDMLKPIIDKNIQEKAYWSDKEHYDSYRRTKAKDNTNMLYGSWALNPIGDSVTPYINKDGALSLHHEEEIRQARYIPIGAAITANARAITIGAIDANYDNWIYSDTDSMYLTKKAVGIKIDDTESGAWKMEGPEPDNSFYYGKFLRQKCYALADANHKIYSHTDKYGNWTSKCVCAGMPTEAKKAVTWDKFKLGYEFTRKQACIVKGGVCIRPVEYHIGQDLEYDKA